MSFARIFDVTKHCGGIAFCKQGPQKLLSFWCPKLERFSLIHHDWALLFVKLKYLTFSGVIDYCWHSPATAPSANQARSSVIFEQHSHLRVLETETKRLTQYALEDTINTSSYTILAPIVQAREILQYKKLYFAPLWLQSYDSNSWHSNQSSELIRANAVFSDVNIHERYSKFTRMRRFEHCRAFERMCNHSNIRRMFWPPVSALRWQLELQHTFKVLTCAVKSTCDSDGGNQIPSLGCRDGEWASWNTCQETNSSALKVMRSWDVPLVT